MALPQTNITVFRLGLAITLVIIMYLSTTQFEYPVVENINDKVSHILAFYVLALFGDFSFPEHKFDPGKIFLLLAYGLFIEIIQYFLPYRTFSLLDLLADAVGLVLYSLSLPALRGAPLLRRRWDSKAY